jgi:hypothetical protein
MPALGAERGQQENEEMDMKVPLTVFAAVSIAELGDKTHWIYVDANDHDTKAKFSLLMGLTRLDLQAKSGDRPLLTLPLSRW